LNSRVCAGGGKFHQLGGWVLILHCVFPLSGDAYWPSPPVDGFFLRWMTRCFLPPAERGIFLNGSFLWGLGGLQWIPACAGMTGGEWSDAGMTEFWVIIMFYKMC